MYNSPWNVAEDFLVDMSFNPQEIATMIKEYEEVNKTGMNIAQISQEIYNYTSGYPYLVSKICKVIDERLDNKMFNTNNLKLKDPKWSKEGIQEAIKIMIKEKTTLFDDLIKNLKNDKELYNTIYSIVVDGKQIVYNIYSYEKGIMYGILKENNNRLVIHNKIFEMLIKYRLGIGQ